MYGSPNFEKRSLCARKVFVWVIGFLVPSAVALTTVAAGPLQSGLNIALKKPAQQSSISAWSHPDDAQGAVDGVKNGSFGFHTNNEKDPWWQVDLLGVATLNEIRVYNRLDLPARAETLRILLSNDAKGWKRVYPPSAAAVFVGGLLGRALGGAPTAAPQAPKAVFGGADGKPLVVDLKGAKARYVRLQLDATEYFHLDEVEIFGVPSSPAPTTQNVTTETVAAQNVAPASAGAAPAAVVPAPPAVAAPSPPPTAPSSPPPITGSGSYQLKRIEVNRKYEPAWLPEQAYRAGPQALSWDERRLRLGWDFNWGDNKQNRNRSMSDLIITELPTFVEPGEDANFAASMSGDWNTSGYGNGRDHTIRLTGALGNGEWSTGGDPNGPYQGAFKTTNKTTVPQPQSGRVVVTTTAAVRFGEDHKGEMEIRFIYEPGTAPVTASAAATANTTTSTPPPTLTPTPTLTPPNAPPVALPSAPAPAPLTFPVLSFEMQLDDASGNKMLEGGERFNFRITVKNTGNAAANNVQVRLGGDPMVVAALGAQKPAGNVAPGQAQIVDFSGILPPQVQPRNAEVRVSLTEGTAELPQFQVLRVGLAPADVRGTTTVLSEVIDVDYPPAPVSIPERTSSVAVIMGISNYRESVIPKLPFAGRDADIFSKYLENVAGVRRENIKILSDDRATRSDIEETVEQWLPLHVTDTSHVYFYYAGHGALDPSTGETYLVPYEGSPDSPSTRMYPIKRLYEKLSGLKVQNVTVFLDSCFSGGGRSIAMRGRPIVISSETASSPSTMNNVSVVAAAGANQVSSDYDKTRHGLFTYFLLKGMRGEADSSRDSWVDLGELFTYVRDSVRSTAVSELNREQTPALIGGPDLESKKNVKLFRVQQ